MLVTRLIHFFHSHSWGTRVDKWSNLKYVFEIPFEERRQLMGHNLYLVEETEVNHEYGSPHWLKGD